MLNDSETPSIRLPLDQLGKTLHMTLWRDGATSRDIVKKQRPITWALALNLAATGGAALLLDLDGGCAHAEFEPVLAACGEGKELRFGLFVTLPCAAALGLQQR